VPRSHYHLALAGDLGYKQRQSTSPHWKGHLTMSTHSYSRLWTHLIWETLKREPMLNKPAAAKASSFLTDYSLQKGIYMKINYVNADHTHALIDLPTNICIEDVIKLFKGGSSFWINQNKIIRGKFRWGGGYGAFSVSHSDVERVARYIANQEQHHRKKTYAEEYETFVRRYGFEWRDEENR
jgi:REP element-mobilizing transposase RayT